jgi:hypothetical protein
MNINVVLKSGCILREKELSTEATDFVILIKDFIKKQLLLCCFLKKDM